MSIFGKIKDAIFGRAEAQPASTPSPATPTTAPAASTPASPATPAPAATTQAPVDVEKILTAAAASVDYDTNWRTSIVDLMKLCGLDPSLANRKELAQELGYTGDMNDSATMNIWLHKQVMAQLAANGGHVPDSLKG